MDINNKIDQLTEHIHNLQSEIKALRDEITKSNKCKIKKIDMPPNNGNKWLSTEDAELINELKQKKTYSEIAEIHQRTRGGIRARVNRHIRTMYHNGIDIKKITEELCIEECIVINAINKKNASRII